MLLSSGGTFLASGIGLTQVAAEEVTQDITEEADGTEDAENAASIESTGNTEEIFDTTTEELPADGSLDQNPTDLVSSFITDAALLADVQAILPIRTW